MIAGVDGCRAGWLVALSESWPLKSDPQLIVCRDFNTVVTVTSTFEVVSVDIPIGLPSDGTRRLCDEQAKERLGVAHTRVFHAPSRPTLVAETGEQFQQLYRQVTGIGAGYPVWGIVPKVKDVDSVMTPALQGRIHEFHPELAWQRLAGRVLASKHTAEGIAERIDVLRRQLREISIEDLLAWKRYTGRAVQRDDILDAMAGLAVAHKIRTKKNYGGRLPAGKSQVDAKGLRMEIWY